MEKIKTENEKLERSDGGREGGERRIKEMIKKNMKQEEKVVGGKGSMKRKSIKN